METKKGEIFLIPIALAEDGFDHLPDLIKARLNQCDVFFAENIRTARRAFKKIGKVTVDYGDTSCQTPDVPKFLSSDRIIKKFS